MKKFLFTNPCFVTTALKPAHYPSPRTTGGNPLPEMAAVGRSNVGKSSLLNHLFRRKNLVRTSSVPGKTQALNFFSVDDALSIVDFPGYGYAKVPQKLRAHWGPMTQTYMEQREQLQVVLFLLDIRRTPTAEDMQLLDWVNHHGKEVVVVLTKADKLGTCQRQSARKKIADRIGLKPSECVLYSVSKNIGRQELVHHINAAFQQHNSTQKEEIIDGIAQ